MQVTRREMMTGVAAIALTSAAGSAFAETGHDEPVDRLLQLSVSDRFTTQEWIYEGQNWTEKRDKLLLFEDEVIELTVRNDSGQQRIINVGRGFRGIPVAPGQRRVFTFKVELHGHYGVGLQPDGGYPMFEVVELPAVVRPSYGKHAPVAV